MRVSLRKDAIVLAMILLFVVYTVPISSVRSAGSDVLHKDGIEFDQKYHKGGARGRGVDTTNPYIDYNPNPLDERYLTEGPLRLNVLIFADEEEEPKIRSFVSNGKRYTLDWEDYAVWQIERGDEALVAEFGIDIRVVGVLTWDSDDSKEWFDEVFYEFWYENEHYLRSEYGGHMIDVIIGITAQSTSDNLAGLCHVAHPVILLKWQQYWMNDNLVQHEASHLFYADDHSGGGCIMGDSKALLFWIYEEGVYYILWGTYVSITYRTHEYCSGCYNVIYNDRDRFPIPPGDANLDGFVDLDDYLIWSEYYGHYCPSWEFWVAGVDPDFNNDGIVDLDDWWIWRDHYGET